MEGGGGRWKEGGREMEGGSDGGREMKGRREGGGRWREGERGREGAYTTLSKSMGMKQRRLDMEIKSHKFPAKICMQKATEFFSKVKLGRGEQL